MKNASPPNKYSFIGVHAFFTKSIIINLTAVTMPPESRSTSTKSSHGRRVVGGMVKKLKNRITTTPQDRAFVSRAIIIINENTVKTPLSAENETVPRTASSPQQAVALIKFHQYVLTATTFIILLTCLPNVQSNEVVLR